VQAFGDAGKDWAALGARFVADGDDAGEKLPGLEDIEDGACFLLRKIDADFLHCFNDERIQDARLEAGAFAAERVAAKMIEPRLGHLAAGAVVNADEKDRFQFSL
jgi:hypothetical protein